MASAGGTIRYIATTGNSARQGKAARRAVHTTEIKRYSSLSETAGELLCISVR